MGRDVNTAGDRCPRCGGALDDADGASWYYCPTCKWPDDDDEMTDLTRLLAKVGLKVRFIR